MNAFVVSGLVKRRAQLAGDIEKAHEALRQMVLDLENLDATILQFEPDFKVEFRPVSTGCVTGFRNLLRRRHRCAAAHAGHQLRLLAGDCADDLDRLADRIDPAAEPRNLCRIILVGFVDMYLKGVAGFQPA